MGCTSGGARVTTPVSNEGDSSLDCPPGTPAGAGTSRMFHLRTLDWSGTKLRRIIIELDFLASEGGPAVARTLTYFGYVGVLTGVRRGLSVSLSRRPRHDRSSLLSPASSQGMKQMELTINSSVKRKRGIIAVRAGLMATRRRMDAREHDLEGQDPHCHCGEGRDRNMTPEDLLVMVKNRPMSNTQTQYAVIMDPLGGAVVWRMRRSTEPMVASDADAFVVGGSRGNYTNTTVSA